MMIEFRYFHAERFVQRITLAVGLACVVLIFIKGARVDWLAYAQLLVTVTLLIALGLWYRHSGRDANIGTTALCAGWFIAFTLALSLFNYLLMPHWAPTLDPYLAAVDHYLLGYHWPSFVTETAQYPLVYEAMRYAYQSTLPQIACLMVALGLSGRIAEMYTG